MECWEAAVYVACSPTAGGRPVVETKQARRECGVGQMLACEKALSSSGGGLVNDRSRAARRWSQSEEPQTRARSSGRVDKLAIARLRLGMILVLCGGVCGPAVAITYVYDDVGRLAQAVDEDGGVSTYRYDPVGNIVAIDRGVPSCPVQPPIVTDVASGTCYAGASCQVAIVGNSLLGGALSTGSAGATLSNCRVECTRATCVLTTTFDFTPGTVQLTATTSFGTAGGEAEVVVAPVLQGGGAAGIWHFAANGGQVITLGMTRIPDQPDGSSTLDPYLELQDSRGFVIATDDDSGSNLPPGPGNNAVVANVTLPATDTYIVIARGGGGTYGSYVLNITPNTIALLPGTVVPPPQGQLITFSGSIGALDERDTFSFAANGGETARVEVDRVANNPDGSGTLEPTVEVRDSRNVVIASDDDGGTNMPPGPGRNALIPNLLLPATDTYRVVVFSSTGSIGPYTVKITLSAPVAASVSASTGDRGTP